MTNTTEERFEIRPFEKPICAREVGQARAWEGDVAIGDEVVLHPVGYDRTEEVYVRVSAIDKGGALTGNIDRANRLGARGQPEFEKGDAVKFSEKNVIRLMKAR